MDMVREIEKEKADKKVQQSVQKFGQVGMLVKSRVKLGQGGLISQLILYRNSITTHVTT